MATQGGRPTNDERRRILLCAIGMSPQIVTETLYALAVNPGAGRSPWIPHEIQLVTTRRGAQHAVLNLLSGTPGWFHRLCRDYGLPHIEFSERTIHALTGEDGGELEDIRTIADNGRAADQICWLVSGLTSQPDTELHVSLAGGRKTMGYYLGYALSLFGRAQDRLSHVLVSEPYEGHPDFYYPTPGQSIIHTRDPKMPVAIDCQDARVQLAEIPFIRFNDGLPDVFRDGKAGFMQTVQMANRMRTEVHMELHVKDKVILINGQSITLKPPAFALYWWFARAHQAGLEGIDWYGREGEWGWGEEGYLNLLLKLVSGRANRFYDVAETKLIEWFNHNKGPAGYFSPLLSRVNKTEFENLLGFKLAQRCTIQKIRINEDKSPVYALPTDLKVSVI
jgi:CRISPR-associated protein (TIGR02584 family)